VKVQCLANPNYSPLKTASRNFNMLNIALKYRLYYGRKRGKFTAKEPDAETGLYYYGARYLDPKTSRWLSGDPAMGEYLPVAGQENDKLPNGGVYNFISLHSYNYSNNNPLKYSDPNGDIPFFAIGIAVGIAMLPRQGDGFLYFDTWQPQFLGGYINLYEKLTSNNLVCNSDSLRTDFKRFDGSTASIWIWKGDYNLVFNGGWHTGAEIGVYNDILLNFGTNKILKSASFTLTDEDGNEIMSRSLAGKWWINSFVKGKGTGATNGANGDPSSMKISVTLDFYYTSDAISFFNEFNGDNSFFPSINNEGLKRDEYKKNSNLIIISNRVTLEFQ